MSDEAGQVPQTGQEPTTNDAKPPVGEQTFTAEYVEKLRQEAAKHRTNAKTFKQQIAELKPLADKFAEQEEAAKSSEQKLKEQLAEMQSELAKANQAALLANQQRQLLALATKAGVDADVLPLLNVSAFDLENEEATLEALKALAKPGGAGGSVSNPGKGPQIESEEDRKNRLFGGTTSTLFRSN